MFDGRLIAFAAGDTVAAALIRAGIHPRTGGCLCMSGDCPHCLVVADGVAYTRSCLEPARPGLVCEHHPSGGLPGIERQPPPRRVRHRHHHCQLVVIGGGSSGAAYAAQARSDGIMLRHVDQRGNGGAETGSVIGIYPGPRIVVRTAAGMVEIHAPEVVIATGRCQRHPVCDGADATGLYTAAAAQVLRASAALIGEAADVTEPPFAFETDADGGLRAVVYAHGRRVACRAATIALGTDPRDALARSAAADVRVIGGAARPSDRLTAPVQGVVCPCMRVSVTDITDARDRGFVSIELCKRATLAGTGPCQGAVCLPYLRALLAGPDAAPAPFTARPPVGGLTLREAAAGAYLPATRRSRLDAEHRRAGARMERFGGWWRPWSYGDTQAEYWAVRSAVSIGDVSTLGRLLVAGADSASFLEYVYPCRVDDLQPGRARYALLLNDAGFVIDDGVILCLAPDRFLLTFTTTGATAAEAHLRDHAELVGARVAILDRSAALGAINVTGPDAPGLLRRLGAVELPGFLRHTALSINGVSCLVLRLGFTGEASFELHHPATASVALWRLLLSTGAEDGIRPHGLDALMTLRLEKGHIIVGQDTQFDSTPRRLGMAGMVSSTKADFVGRRALARNDSSPDPAALVGLVMPSPAPPEGAVVRRGGDLVGHVTSSRDAPVLGHAVALALIADPAPDGEVMVDGRQARVTQPPFYDPSGARMRVS